MAFIGGREDSENDIRSPFTRPAYAPAAFGISADEAVALPTLLADGLAIFLLGAITGTGYHVLVLGNYGQPRIYAGVGFLVAVIFCGATRLLNGARPMNASLDARRARLALTVWVMTFLFLATVAFSLKIGAAFSRGAIFSFFFAGVPAVPAMRVMVPRVLARTLYANAYRGREVVIAAPFRDPALAHLSAGLRQKGCGRVHVVEFDGGCSQADWPAERQRLLRRMLDTARIAGPGEIYLLNGTILQERISSIQAGLRLVPRAVFLVPTDAVAGLFGLPARRIGRTVAVETQKVPLSAIARGVKRAIDVATATTALIVLAPVFGLIALAIKTDSKGPVFFLQRRNGYRGREFRIVKFRTMTVLEDGDDVTQVRRDDQRVTRIGRWLRKTSFDEIPQLWNILRGEMSLVGPRPHAVAHDELYAKLIENYELRQHVKPGVTGWAQINGLRGETPTVDSMFRRIEFDLWYAANCSVMLDLQILLRTLLAVLRQDNAY